MGEYIRVNKVKIMKEIFIFTLEFMVENFKNHQIMKVEQQYNIKEIKRFKQGRNTINY